MKIQHDPVTSQLREPWQLVQAASHHVAELARLEKLCFPYDALSRRSLRRFMDHAHADFVVLEKNADIVGYAILLYRPATRLARVYSLAVNPVFQRQGAGRYLMDYCIEQAHERKNLFLRLEVKTDNQPALALCHSEGFVDSGIKSDYFDDHSDAVVLQKQLHYFDKRKVPAMVPLLTQTTPFTCGPVSLLMAMLYFNKPVSNTEEQELMLWRSSTTIFMTSGHGGCGPHGLARVARKSGLDVALWVNQSGPVLLDSVRSESKKDIMARIQMADIRALYEMKVPIHHEEYSLSQLELDLEAGSLVMALISTYQFDGSKAPHWVLITAVDSEYVYINDPDDDLLPWQTVTERQYLPIPREVFVKSFGYGRSRLKTAVVVGKSISDT